MGRLAGDGCWQDNNLIGEPRSGAGVRRVSDPARGRSKPKPPSFPPKAYAYAALLDPGDNYLLFRNS